jgi:hypothetical protein
MNCRHCRATIKARYITKTTIAVATELHFSCGSEKCLSTKKNTMEAETVGNANNYASDKRGLSSVSCFSANWCLMAATQLFGKNQKSGEILAVFLYLAPSAFCGRWSKMEDLLAAQHEKVAHEIIYVNLKESSKDKILFLVIEVREHVSRISTHTNKLLSIHKHVATLPQPTQDEI